MHRQEQIDHIARDCVYFKGDTPCMPHRKSGATCRCPLYAPRGAKLLVIQLGDVEALIHTSALLRRLREDHPSSHLICLSHAPELVADLVDESLGCDGASLARLQVDQFDAIYNLNISRRACALSNLLQADQKKGYYLRQGLPTPSDSDAHASYLLATFPGSIAPDKRPGPVRRLFDLCGLEYRLERTRLQADPSQSVLSLYDAPVVGLYTLRQSGDEPYFWEESRWQDLADRLAQQGATIVLLGDEEAEFYNHEIEHKCPAIAVTNGDLFTLVQDLVACDVVVCTPGRVAELSVALGRQVVLLPDEQAAHGKLEHHGSRVHLIDPPDSDPAVPLEDLLPDKVARQVNRVIEQLPARTKQQPAQPQSSAPAREGVSGESSTENDAALSSPQYPVQYPVQFQQP